MEGTDGKIDRERINVRKRERERFELKEFEVAEKIAGMETN